MPPVDRNKPIKAKSSDSRWSLMDFLREYPDDETCLDFLWRERFAPDGHTAHCPNCDQSRKFHRIGNRPSYDCDSCGYHIHPTAGTIFHKSSTSLHLWFYAMHLMTSTRCGISAKQLEREIGVNYKTAHRMMRLIRAELMTQDDAKSLTGDVEADETWVGGKPRAADIRRSRAATHKYQESNRIAAARKTAVFGAVQRQGQVRASVIPDSSSATLGRELHRYVLPAATIYTDEWAAYITPGREYAGHRRIAHKENIYVSGTVHTNTIEGFFSLVKNGIRGVYHSVSKKHLQGYLNEYVWRYNTRRDARSQFETLLLRAARS